MAWELPENAPRNTGEAFEYVGRLGAGATIDDLKILALTEALGQELYYGLAAQVANPEVQALLRRNGDEELAHAHRLGEALEILTGEAFPIPPIAENPIYTPLESSPVTKASLTQLAELEFAGQDLYAGIAASFDNPAAIALFRQNGVEEVEHGHRLKQASALLDA